MPLMSVTPIRSAAITISDGCAHGKREDLSGGELVRLLEDFGAGVVTKEILPDDLERISERLRQIADSGAVDLILTTGGTGLSPRDHTPEATLAVIDRQVPGLAELMRAEGLKSTPLAVLSRAVAGIRGRTLIVNLPGSPRGVVESFAAIRASLSHAIKVLTGQPSGH